MPARLTPAQKTFGIGLLPEYEMFRPPEGMEFDPAYSNFTRNQQGLAVTSDLQKQVFRQQQDDLRRGQEVLQAEDDAIAAMKERPDEIPNILRSFPELARSKNLGGVLNYAQAVQPSAGQKTLAPSLRNRLKPHERQYFDEHFGQNGDAVSAFDAAQLRGEHENGLVDMMKGGVPLDVVDKYRDRPLSPLEREALIQQHAVKHGGEKDVFREQKLKGLLTTLESEVPAFNSDPAKGPVVTLQDVLNKQAANYDMAHRIVYPEKYQQPPAVATPAAEGGAVVPAQTAAVPPQDDGKSHLREILGEKAYPTPEAKQQLVEKSIKDMEEALASHAPEGLLPIEIARQRKLLADNIAEAKDTLAVNKIAQSHVAPIWDEEKRNIDSIVDDYAKKAKIPVSAVWNAIALNSPLPAVDPNVSTDEYSPYDIDPVTFGAVARPSVVLLGDKGEEVNPKFAKALQLLRDENAKNHPIGTLFRSIGNEFKPPTKSKILAEYAKEKAKPVVKAPSTGRVAPKIEVGKPTPVK